MEELKRARRPVRREFDTLHRELEALLIEDPPNEDVVNVKYKVFNDVFENLQTHDAKIVEQLTKEKATEEEEDREFDEIKEYKCRAETIRFLKEKTVPNRCMAPTESVAGGTAGMETKSRNFKLPIVQVKKFNGELKNWLAFWAQFKRIDEDEKMHGSDKFWYLIQSLEPGTDAFEIVSSYPQSNENYPKVIEALKRQYGNPDILLQVYIRELLSLVISNVTSKEKIPLKSLYLKLSSHLRALKTLNLEKADPATWLFPLVESSLPETTLYNWQRNALSSHDGSKDSPQRTRLDVLMSFVEKEVEITQRVEITRSFANDDKKDARSSTLGKEQKFRDRKPEKRKVSTLSSFHVGDGKKCTFCDRSNHETKDCFRAKKMHYDEKMKILREKGLCFRCTGRHIGRECQEKDLECEICRRRHLTVLCRDFKGHRGKEGINYTPKRPRIETGNTPSTSTTANTTIASSMSTSNLECTNEVALQTLMLRVIGGGKESRVRAFIDSGSQRSYILRSTANRLQLIRTGVERVIHSLFGDQRTEVITHNKYAIKVASLDGSFEDGVEVRDHTRLCGSIPSIGEKSPSILEELRMKGVHLSDVAGNRAPIELLIGADIYSKLLTGKIVKLTCGAIAIHTRLGWSVMGNICNSVVEESMANIHVTMSVMDTTVSKLWSLEALGIRDPSEEASAETIKHEMKLKFRENITRTEDGKYSVKLPVKENVMLLPENRDVALKRLRSTTEKLIKTNMYETYETILREWENEGFIEKAPIRESGSRMHYVPHRAVVKAESLTTPVRPVFDASCKVGKSLSLNECLLTGDNLIKLIPEILMKFREKRVGFVSDIRKAFQMIGVDEGDRDLMRFMWWKDKNMNEVIEYRHARVMFGATCSPFILGAVLEHHLTNLSDVEKEIGEKLLASFYVDNCVSSENSIEDYTNFREKSTEILQRAGMDLRMWLSNIDNISSEKSSIISVLGLQWDRKRDEMFVNVKGLKFPEKVTKRNVLSIVHKVFDPLGIVSPVMLPVKMLMKRIWTTKLKWDDILPDKEASEFQKWCREIHHIDEVRIPRMITCDGRDKRGWSLHTFVDASKEAYSAVIYLRDETENRVKVQLITAKSRLAPTKPLTIPKLELMGCLIGTRLMSAVKRALQIENISETYWCDSTTAIAWIKRENLWGTFVSNRTKEIRATTRIEQWRHVPGIQNPADLPSRGCYPSQLKATKWWEGPQWLYVTESLWPKSVESVNEDEINSELRKSGPRVEVVSFLIHDMMRNQHRHDQLVRIVGWVRRFLFNYLTKKIELRKKGPLSSEEIYKAELILIRDIQRSSFPKGKNDEFGGLPVIQDEWGILRVKTRLTYRDDERDFKYPMLLPSKRPEVEQLIIDYHEKYYHAGTGFVLAILRKKFWVLKARRTVKSIVSQCKRCRRFKAKQTIPEAAPLPLDRIKTAEVFETVGTDLAGPLILKNGKKAWLVIYTCAVYRAVHFEVVGSLSSKAFIRSLERFVKRYRRPTTLYLDNGSNFRATQRLFKSLDWDKISKEEGVKQIHFVFSPVYSAWWGGWWERLIRTAKELMRRTLGKAALTWRELEVTIETVAEVMNQRPLTYVSDDPNELEPLTPALFINPLGSICFPERDLTEGERLRFRYQYVKTLRDELKRRFLNEYLALLVNRRPKRATRELRVGELVLVGCDKQKRLEWPLGKILEVIRGRDGIIRLARVKLAGGEVTRTVQRLFPLELEEEQVRENAVVTRSGRRVKRPQKFSV